MDAETFLELLVSVLSTEEGVATVQVIQKTMTQRYGPMSLRILQLAEYRLSINEFSPEECNAFEKSLRLCVDQPSDCVSKDSLWEQVIPIIFRRLHIASNQGCDIIQRFYFIYRNMILVGNVCQLNGFKPGGELKVITRCHSFVNLLWTTLFAETNNWKKREKAIIEMLENLTVLASANLENNPAFSYYLARDLCRAYSWMQGAFTEQEMNSIMIELHILLGKCSYHEEQYSLAIFYCKQASHLDVDDTYRLYELWGRALHKNGYLQAAIHKLEFAMFCVQDEGIKHNLQIYIDGINQEMMALSCPPSSEPDYTWLEDTNIAQIMLQQGQAQQARESHVKKKRHSRPTRPVLEDVQVSCKDETKHLSGGNADQQRQVTSDPLSWNADNIYTEWDTSSISDLEDDVSDLEDAIPLQMTEPEEKEPEVTKVMPEDLDKTWFDESREMYQNGNKEQQIVHGSCVNVNVKSIEANEYRLTRAPFYRQMKPKWELERLMSTMPEKYKHCTIELESCHKALCKLMTTNEKFSEIEIHGRSKCGQTFNRDEVCVEILSQPQSRPAHSQVLTKKTEEENKVFGQVVGVIKSHFRGEQHPVMACTCGYEEGFLMHPLCRSVPNIHALNGVTRKKYPSLSKYRIDTYSIDEKGKLRFKNYFDVKPGLREKYVFLVIYLTWGAHHVYPLGAVVDILDCGTDYTGGLKILEMQYQVPRFYSKMSVDHVGEVLKDNQPVPTDGRVDCTGLTVFTIDPANSKDLDDALSVSVEVDHFLVGVHIADVAAVVKKGDPVDKEAKKRATSFYPGDSRVYHMLPEPLSENLCSLMPDENKITLSVFFHIDKSGKHVKESSVMKTVIKSCQKLSYEETQKIIDHEEVDGVSQPVKENVRLLNEIAQNLRKDRMKDSRFAVPFEDSRFLDSETDQHSKQAHALVEEFMIKANTFIAHWLRKRFPDCIPVCCQSEPAKEDLQKFAQAEKKFMDLVVNLQGREIVPGQKAAVENWVSRGNTVRKESLPIQRNIWLQILDGVHEDKMKTATKALCKDEVHPFQAIVLENWKKIMESAKYKCSSEPEQELAHFSLNTKMYTHFTSPIRRYVDLIVHRLVHAALEGKPCPYTAENMSDMCAYINDATSRQKHFSSGCRALKRAERMSQRPMVFQAFVDTVTDSGAELCIPSLKHISNKSRELPFNLMDLSKKPEKVPDALSGRDVAWVKWKKRLYDCTGCPNQLIHSNSEASTRQKNPPYLVVDPHQYVCFVDAQVWSKILKAYFKDDLETLNNYLGTLTKEGRDPPVGPPVRDIVTSEYGNGSVKFHQCKFEFCFATGRVVKVQMVANPLNGILTPKIRMIFLCKNLTLCVRHMEDPIGVLSKYATDSTKKQITSVDEYQRTWLPILEMEAATTAVHSEENIIINNVNLEFTHRAGKIGRFTFPSKFVIDRCIEFGGKAVEQIQDENDSIDNLDSFTTDEFSSIDYLCIRCQVQKPKMKTPITSTRKIYPKVIEVTCPMKNRKKRHQSPVSRITIRPKRRKKVVEVECPMKKTAGWSDGDPYTWVGHGQIVRVRKSKDSGSGSGHVTVTFKLNSNCVTVPDHFSSTTTGTVEVIFKSKVDRTAMKMLQLLTPNKEQLARSIALNLDVPMLERDRYLIGCNSKKDVFETSLPRNNPKQQDAIEKALTSTFTVIQGPPGTGKTYTGIKLMFLFTKLNKKMFEEGFEKEKQQVLFCGPSNAAVDLVAKYMKLRLGKLCPKILRVYGSNIELKDYPVPKRNFMSKRSLRDLKSDPDLKDVTLHHMIRMSSNSLADKIEKYDNFFRNCPNAVTVRHVKKYNKYLFTACCEEIAKCDVILCTCAVGGSMRLIKSAKVYQVIIDECAMSTEPQSMIPIIATEAKQVVLIGDHQQLRPIIQCREAAALGLEQSLFERYASKATFLNWQYRMHPRICEFPSEVFYERKLLTGLSQLWKIEKPLSLWPKEDIPVVFCHVEGVEESLSVSSEEGNEQSKSNKDEVEKVDQVFTWLMRTEKIQPININVMSQYNAQCTRIKERLRRYCKNQSHLNVNTVVASQGGEWDYVILSTVRSLPHYKIETAPTHGWRKHNLGFISDANQINVALTRARKGLIIIGNKNLLRTDNIFSKLLEKYRRQGCLVDGSEFPSKRR